MDTKMANHPELYSSKRCTKIAFKTCNFKIVRHPIYRTLNVLHSLNYSLSIPVYLLLPVWTRHHSQGIPQRTTTKLINPETHLFLHTRCGYTRSIKISRQTSLNLIYLPIQIPDAPHISRILSFFYYWLSDWELSVDDKISPNNFYAGKTLRSMKHQPIQCLILIKNLTREVYAQARWVN